MDARELLEQAYERWLRTGELPADLMHPDVALHNAMSTGEPAYRGPEGWRQWQKDLEDVWDGLTLDAPPWD